MATQQLPDSAPIMPPEPGRIGAAVATGPGCGAAAVREARAHLTGPAAIVLAFPSGSDAGEVARDCDAAASGAPVAGMTTKGVLGSSGYAAEGCSALAFGHGFAAGVGTAHSASDDLRAAARQATAQAFDRRGSDRRDHDLLLLFIDAGSGDQSEAVAGAYSIAGRGTPLLGGGAGGDPGTAVPIAGGAAAPNAVVAVALTSEQPIAVTSGHGCTTDPVPAIVTRSNGPLIEEIDGRPAADVYLEHLGIADPAVSDAEFERLAVSHPLCQPELRGQGRLRHVRGRVGSALLCATHVPVDAAIEFARESKQGIIDSAASAARRAREATGGEPKAVLVFDCAGRKASVGDGLERAVEELRSAFAPSTPIAGGFTFGEIARTRGAKGDLNHAITIASFA